MKYFLRITLASFFAAFCFIYLVPAVSAASNSPELTLSPANITFDTTLAPNHTYRGSFKIINSGTVDTIVKVTPTPYSVQNEAYDPDYSTKKKLNQLADWISFSQESYTLTPNQTKTVNYTITTPSTLPDGDQYAMLMAEIDNSSKASDGNQVQTISRVGVKLLAHTNGKDINDASAVLPHTPAVIAGNAHNFLFSFTNHGNTDFQGDYAIKISNVFNNATLFESEQTAQILPDTRRTLPVAWDITQNIGIYRVTLTATTTDGVKTTTKIFVALTSLGLIAVVILLAITGAVVAQIILRRLARVKKAN